MIDGGNFTDSYRKRLYWCNWNLCPSESVSIVDKGHNLQVDVTVNKPLASSWISEDYVWLGPHLVPTLTRALPSERPMKKPAGIETVSNTAIERCNRRATPALV